MQEDPVMGKESPNIIRSEVLGTLKDILNRHRQIAEREEGVDSPLNLQTESTSAWQVAALDPDRQKLNNQDFEAEIKLKKSYGKWFLVILACQLLIMNAVFIFDGAKLLEFKDLTLQLYMGGTLTEVFGLVLVVTKYLFKRK